MIVRPFVFNDFYENTYVLSDQSNECVIVDPGCNNEEERNQLFKYIEDNNLKPVRLINTHCHIDHVLGNAFIAMKYDLKLEAHEGEKPVLDMQEYVSRMYHISYDPSPPIELFHKGGDQIAFGKTCLSVLYTPGHSPASISLYNKESGELIAGDVLFREGIGRTDLPGGSMETILNSIREQFFTLPHETTVYSGHGPVTTIGHEIENNPFLRN